LKSPVCRTIPASVLIGDRERVGDRVVDREELEAERAVLLDLLLLHRPQDGLDAVLAQLGLEQGEGEGAPTIGMSARSRSRYGTAPRWSSCRG
jgi:hypothetical protein